MKEVQLRNKLAENLSILEPGLTLIQMEHPVANPFGSSGFIDILARDRFGNRVLIELKRSNQAARQALHEILKYVALFKIVNGVANDRLRCLIVSTDWKELLVPFANFIEVAEYQTDGYQLNVDSDGALSAERITVPVLPESISPFEHHGTFLFSNEQSRAEALPFVQMAVKTHGATSYLLISMDYKGEAPHVIYPFAIYLVPLRLTEEAKMLYKSIAIKDISDTDLKTSEIELAIEERYHCAVNNELRFFHDQFGRDYTYEIGFPQKFQDSRHKGWTSTKIERHGALGDSAADDEEVLRLVAGIEGKSDIYFGRSSSPRLQLAWNQLRSGSSRCLNGNPVWERGYEWFCDWIENDWPEALVAVSVYNPMNLPFGLLHYHGDSRTDYLPAMELIASDERSGRVRGIIGELIWDGTTVPKSVAEILGSECEEFFEFLMHMQLGTAWTLDETILRAHGLSYGLRVGEFDREEAIQDRLIFTKSGAERRPAKEEESSFIQFANASKSYLDELVSEIRSTAYFM